MAKDIIQGVKAVSRAKIIIRSALFLIGAALFTLAACSAEPEDALLGGTSGGSDGSGTSTTGVITITKNPVTPIAPYPVGATPTALTVEAELSIPEGGEPAALEYQWWSYRPGTDPAQIEGATSSTLTLTPRDTAQTGLTLYFAQVSATDKLIEPKLSLSAAVVVSNASATVVVLGGSLKEGAFLNNAAAGTVQELTSTDIGETEYDLAPGVWTLEQYMPSGKVVSLYPSNGRIEIQAGGKQKQITATVSDAPENTGTIVVYAGEDVTLSDIRLTSNGKEDVQVNSLGGTYSGLDPGLWTLTGLPGDGSLVTNPAAVIVEAGKTNLITVTKASVPVSATTGTIIVSVSGTLPDNVRLDGPDSVLRRIGGGGAAYTNLPPGTWTINGLPGSATTSPNPPTIYLEAGKTELIAVNIPAPPSTGIITITKGAGSYSIPATAVLVGQGGNSQAIEDTTRNYTGLSTGVWYLAGLPEDGTVTTEPSPAIVYLTAGVTKNITVTVNAPILDTDGDGYPDAWEEAHANEGFNVTQRDTPYGMDLSRVGAVPPGVTWTEGTKTYTVRNEGIARIYRVYKSDPNNKGQNVAENIEIAAGAEATLILDQISLKGNLRVYNGAHLTLRSMGAYEDQPKILVPDGARATVVLDGARLTGNAPVDIESGGKLTLLLNGTNEIRSNNVGIHVPVGAEISIGSASGTGSTEGFLSVDGEFNSGIGGDDAENGGSIAINGGTIEAHGSSGAGIGGGGNGGDGGNIAISGGKVRASSSSGAAIGGGNGGNGGNIAISGGTLIAGVSGSGGAAIGGGNLGSGGSVSISGNAIVYAYNNSTAGYPAAIGAGSNGNCGTVTISGGVVVAIAAPANAPSIGNASGVAGGSIAISGGTVIANNSIGAGYSGALAPVTISGNPVIFAAVINGAASDPANGIISDGESAVVESGDSYPATAGTITVSAPFSVPAAGVLTVPLGWTLDIGENALTNNGTIYANWNGNGAFSGNTPQTGARYGTLTGVTPEVYDAVYDVGLGNYTITQSGNYKVIGNSGSNDDGKAITVHDGVGPVRITLQDVSINKLGHPDIDIGMGNTVTMLLEGSSVLRCYSQSQAALRVVEGSTLIIDSKASTNAGAPANSGHALSGKIRVYEYNFTNSYGAAIGGNWYEGAGNITILGGTVEVATCPNSTYGALIGGGDEGKGGNVTVSGGVVLVEGYRDGPAIGSGRNASESGTLTVTGGFVAAFRTENEGFSSAIGGGSGAANGGVVSLTGGTVVAIKGTPTEGSGGNIFGGYAIGPSYYIISDGTRVEGTATDMSGSNLNTTVLFATDMNATGYTAGAGLITGGDFSFTKPVWNDSTYTYSGGTITLNRNFTVPSGASLIIPAGWTLNLGGHSLYNSGGTIYYNSNGSTATVPGQKVDSPDYGAIVNY